MVAKGGRDPRVVLLRVAMLGITGMTVTGCSTLVPTNDLPAPQPDLNQILRDEGVTPGSVPSGMLRPDGTLKNGLIPEQWGDTS